MHISQDGTGVAEGFEPGEPVALVMGPGGLSEAYPFQPPRRAMIQLAQAREPAA
jgi:hypothetical protein